MEITAEQKMNGQALLNSLINKAQDDQVFRNELITNPYQVLENFGCPKDNFSNEFKFSFEDQTDDSIIYLNIPRKVDLENLELSDEQLEIVSGGEFFVSFGIGVAIGCTAVGIAYVASHVTVTWN
jgi:hypothetical protein